MAWRRRVPLPSFGSACGAGAAAAAGVAGCPPANRSGQCTEVGGARSTPTVPGACGKSGARAAREGARWKAGRSRNLRLRTRVVFHKAALKVSWQPPAARLCKETTETSRSVEQRLLCCPDFLRNLNELFVDNH